MSRLRTGTVYTGEWRRRAVAIKKIPPHELVGEQSFRQELAALSAVQNEHVLPVLAFNEHGDPEGNQYIMTPVMVGGDLDAAMPRLMYQQRLYAMQDAGKGLFALHEQNFLQ